MENTTITNTLVTVEKNGTKVWKKDSDNLYNTRPASITVYAMNGEEVVASTTATSANNWAWSFTALPKYDKEGKEIKYTFEEKAVTGYETSYNNDHTQIINTLKTVDIEVTKIWMDEGNIEGLRPTEITLTLTKKVGDAAAVTVETVPVTGDETAESWSYKWTKLPALDSDGNKITYAVSEVVVNNNYKAPVITGDAENGYVVTNSRDVEYVTIPVTKVWQDNNNAQGFRPGSVKVQLVKVVTPAADGAAQDSIVLDGADMEFFVEDAYNDAAGLERMEEQEAPDTAPVAPADDGATNGGESEMQYTNTVDGNTADDKLKLSTLTFDGDEAAMLHALLTEKGFEPTATEEGVLYYELSKEQTAVLREEVPELIAVDGGLNLTLEVAG